jgi:RNA polymerase-interacting CarD/CdnL/TRCF family regulator
MSERPFQIGQAVFLASAGLGQVVELAGRDASGKPGPLAPGAPPAFYVVEVEDAVACVPVDQPQSLRAPVDAETAAQMLEVLRGAPPSPPSLEPVLERGKRVVHSGTPLEHAHLLRELYGMPVPLSEPIASGLAFISGLVLPEIASVLELDAADLVTEMRHRHPAAQDAVDRQALLRFHPR